jgi:hypothetical protein
MVDMFNGSQFTGDLSRWDVTRANDMTGMFVDAPPMSVATYDALLNSWGSQAVRSRVRFDAGSSQYSTAGEAARQSLIGDHLWIINDGGRVD